MDFVHNSRFQLGTQLNVPVQVEEASVAIMANVLTSSEASVLQRLPAIRSSRRQRKLRALRTVLQRRELERARGADCEQVASGGSSADGRQVQVDQAAQQQGGHCATARAHVANIASLNSYFVSRVNAKDAYFNVGEFASVEHPNFDTLPKFVDAHTGKQVEHTVTVDVSATSSKHTESELQDQVAMAAAL